MVCGDAGHLLLGAAQNRGSTVLHPDILRSGGVEEGVPVFTIALHAHRLLANFSGGLFFFFYSLLFKRVECATHNRVLAKAEYCNLSVKAELHRI